MLPLLLVENNKLLALPCDIMSVVYKFRSGVDCRSSTSTGIDDGKDEAGVDAGPFSIKLNEKSVKQC